MTLGKRGTLHAHRRAVQLIQTLNVILRDPETAPLIDSDRIGVLGVGPGGTAAILEAERRRVDASRVDA